jgi:gliding motility-associated-like protein
MNGFKYFFSALILCCLSTKVSAQIIVDDTKTAVDLVNNTLINSSCINIGTVRAEGNPTGGNSYGTFNAGNSGVPFATGIVLSSSPSINAQGPFNLTTSIGVKNDIWPGDTDLNQSLDLSESTQATVLEFDFTALTNSISFNYIFASNEYQKYYPCLYSDGFAFLIKEAGTSQDYKNLAVLPNTNTAVLATTVHPNIIPTLVGGQMVGCDAINEEFFNGYNTFNSPINYAGQTTVMNAHTEVIPGITYHLKLVVADDFTRQYNSAVFIEGGSFLSKVSFGNDRTIANNNPLCFGETTLLKTRLDDTQYTFKWFKQDASNNYVEISPVQAGSSYNVTSTGNYKVEATVNGTTCVTTGEIKIEYAPEILFTNTSLFQCDDNTDGIAIFNLTKIDNIVKNNDSNILNKGYYETPTEARSKTNAIANPEHYTNQPGPLNTDQIVYARIENKYGCYKIVEVTLKVSNTSISTQAPINTCDGDDNQDGFYQFDLATQVSPQVLTGLPNGLTVHYFLTGTDALTETNALPNLFKNTNTPTQTIYARIMNGADCYDITPITLVVHTFDPPNFGDESQILCKGNQTTLSVATGFAGYLWSTGDTTNAIVTDIPGDYSVTVTDVNGCEKTKKFKIVPSEPATITNAVVKDFSGIDNTVLIEYTGGGHYEFSLDGIIFQDEPLFTRVTPGIYNAVSRDKNGCGLSNVFLLYVLDYPRFVTPNGDGFNDLWAVKDFDQLPDYKITIFDRYGKLLKQMSKNSPGWNGLFNGEQLPADDYWFNLLLTTGQTIKGHFSLKR